MSRSGYTDEDGDCSYRELYWANQERAFSGKRGQAFLKEMLASMDALPDKKLIAGLMQEESGEVCAIGSVGKARGLDMEGLNRLAELAAEDDDCGRHLVKRLSNQFNIAESMAADIMYMNDDAGCRGETSEQRFTRMRAWIEKQIRN